MSKMATWHDNGHGPRVLISIGGEDLQVTEDRARQLHRELGTVLAEIAKAKTPLERLRELADATPLSARVPSGAPYRTPPACDHGVTFDERAWHKADVGIVMMTAEEVRKRWPRLDGDCPKGCGYRGIAYASRLHFIAGDW